MIRIILIAVSLCLSALSWSATARADGATLYVNEVEVLTFRTKHGSSTPASRAKYVAKVLDQRKTIDLTIKNGSDSSKLFSRGETIITITKEEAARHGTSPAGLAARWGKALLQAWTMADVEVSQSSVSVAVGKTLSVPVFGPKARTAPLLIENGESISVTRSGAAVRISGLAEGTARVLLGSEPSAPSISVRVLPVAAVLPQSIHVSVVGSPAASDMVRGTLETALRTRLTTAPGSKVEFVTPKAGELPVGESRTYKVAVKATAPNAVSAEGTATVTVSNLAVAHRRETELWYCNEPENVRGPQSLFSASLRREEPARMLYHHINISSSPLYFRVMMVNNSDQTAKVVIIPGDSKDPNPVLAGVMAADPFFRSWVSGSGEVVSIPAGESLPISFRRLAPQDTSSGLCYLRLLPDGPEQLQVVAEALAPFEFSSAWQAALITPTPWREVGTSILKPTFEGEPTNFIFPEPFKDEEFVYRAGGNFGFFRVGQRPIDRQDSGQPLEGNFGVIYSIKATAENPTDAPVPVELVYETSAGYSGGLFSVDGKIVRLPLMQSKAEARLARFTLAPGESKSIQIMTVPLSGSSYPVTLTMRPVSNLPDLKYDGK